MSKKEMTFTEFLTKYYKPCKHGHEFTHEDVDGQWFKRSDYEEAEDRYIDYQWDCFRAKLFPKTNNKGLKHA